MRRKLVQENSSLLLIVDGERIVSHEMILLDSRNQSNATSTRASYAQ